MERGERRRWSESEWWAVYVFVALYARHLPYDILAKTAGLVAEQLEMQ